MFKSKLSEFTDKLVLLSAMLLFLWVGVSAIREAKLLEDLSSQNRPMLSEMKLNAPKFVAAAPVEKKETWKAPENQSRGSDWVFDVFTPPVIYYDPNSQEFAVTPPNLHVPNTDNSMWASFDLELIEVRLRPYRLQLKGYSGEPGNFLAHLENTATGELILVREGQEIDKLGVRMLSFQEQRVEVLREDSMPVLQKVGVARLFDHASKSEISLTNLETKMFSDLEARVRVVQEGAVHLVKTGSRVELDTGDYIIGDLSAQPEEALITKISKDGSRRFSKTLTPISKPELKPQGEKRNSAESPFAIRPTQSRKKPQS